MAAASSPLCYCGQESRDKEDVLELPWEHETLQCTACKANIHIKCLKAPTPSTLLNDYLYKLTCARCTPPGEDESYVRPSKMPNLYIVSLILHNLQSTKEGNQGYFHYKKDIASLCLQHLSHLLPKNQTKGMAAGVSSTLSGYSSHFLNGSKDLGVSGWWRMRVNRPPFLSVAPKEAVPASILQSTRSGTRTAKKKDFSDFFVEPQIKRVKSKMAVSKSTQHTKDDQVDISKKMAVREISSLSRKTKKLNKPTSTHPPQVTLPVTNLDVTMETECLASESKPDMEAVQLTPLKSEPFDMKTADEDVMTSLRMDMSTEDVDFQPCSGLQIDTSALVEELPCLKGEPGEVTIEVKPQPVDPSSRLLRVKEEPTEQPAHFLQTSGVDGRNTPSEEDSVGESKPTPPGGDPVPSHDHSTQPIAEEKEMDQPVEHTINSRDWSVYEEGKLLAILDNRAKYSKSISAKERLLRRLAIVRKIKRSQGLPLFNINTYLNAPQFPIKQSSTNSNIGSGLSAPLVPSAWTNRQTLDRYQSESIESHTGYFVPFINKLKGGASQLSSTRSCYTARILKPYIWQDFETRPPKLKILNEIRMRSGEEFDLGSIDYKYVTPDHIPLVNKICHQAFWPSIDLSECLQYSDFSCVAMYKKLIIGFAFMVPDVNHNEAYISFIYTHPDWRGAGIASIMLYHLIQTCMGKDVTLHVSMTNPAIGLYFKFGFQVVEIIHNFYDKYHPIDSTQSPHAFYMKLDRY